MEHGTTWIIVVVLFVGFLIFMLSTQGFNNGSGTLIAILIVFIIPWVLTKITNKKQLYFTFVYLRARRSVDLLMPVIFWT